MLGPALLAASRSNRVRNLITSAPGSRRLVGRFVVGESLADALDASRTLVSEGLAVTLDHLGEDTLDVSQADATRETYVALLGRLAELDLAGPVEVSLKLSALGQALPGDGDQIALENARAICAAAQQAGTTVTLDMEDHTTVDSTLSILRELRVDFPGTGAVLQSCLHRTEADCRDLAHAGFQGAAGEGRLRRTGVRRLPGQGRRRPRVRPVPEDPDGRRRLPHGGQPRPSHDRAGRGAGRAARPRARELRVPDAARHPHRRAAAAGCRGSAVRVYVPYGADWYGYFMRRLAERPANVAFFLRSLVSR